MVAQVPGREDERADTGDSRNQRTRLLPERTGNPRKPQPCRQRLLSTNLFRGLSTSPRWPGTEGQHGHSRDRVRCLARRADEAGVIYRLLGSRCRYQFPGTILPVPEADGPREDRQMTGTGRHMRSKLRSSGYMMGATAGRQLRAQILPLTPRVIFRALLGVFLFLCGIVFGVWLIIRFRRHVQDSSPELSRLRQTHRARQRRSESRSARRGSRLNDATGQAGRNGLEPGTRPEPRESDPQKQPARDRWEMPALGPRTA